MGDFLKKDVKTPLCGYYFAAGIRLRIETNSESILEIARANLEPTRIDSGLPEEVRLKLWVDDEISPRQKCRPYFRGLGHLVFSGYDDKSSLLIDLRDRCGAGRFAKALVQDSAYWKTILIPSVLGILGPSVGMTSLHSACVGWNGSGMLLVGEGGAGKSTLSLALAQAGCDFLSDDRTLVGEDKGKLMAWGLSREMKQRADAVGHFPELKNQACQEKWNAEPVYRFDPTEVFGVRRVSSCDPRWIVFLERQTDGGFELERVLPDEASSLLRRGLHQEMPETSDRQRATIQALSQKRCFRLRYGGDPHTIASQLRQVLILNRQEPSVVTASSQMTVVRSNNLSSDPLRRFRATCLRSDVLLMGRHLRIETDSALVLRRITEVFNVVEAAPRGLPQFVWRIVSEPREELGSIWPSKTAFCEGSLRYISLGQYTFIAVDLEAREAVGILPDSLCEDSVGFSTVFLASLLHLSAPSLGLTAVSAACVSRGRNGLLLFGPPRSGKTTATYWGKKLGLDFHADQATFLELDAGAVYAWGEFWPAAFRPETLTFLPEISKVARSFTYGDRDFLCVDKTLLSGASRGRVVPAACIFLERQAAAPPRLVPLPRWEIPQQNFTDAGSEEDRNAIVTLLGRVPAYRLLYDDDPSIAARFFRSVLDAHQLMEQRV